MLTPIFRTIYKDQTSNYGKFILEPLHPGFGHTLGSALRRILLSHIPGAAPTYVKIEGARHQFTTLSGLKEDLVELILNIKQLQIKYTGEQPAKMRLSAKGPGEVAASQIDCPPDIAIANPDFVIANLSSKTDKLDIEITVESGSGYSPSEDRSSSTIGVIPVDAIFSPIIRVNYHISGARVGRATDYDSLTLEIWTDGTISPKDAFLTSANILKNFINQIVNPQDVPQAPKTTTFEPINPALQLTVEELELPTRIANALRKAGLDTVKKLAQTDKSEIVKVKNLGGKSLKIVEAALKDKGVELSSS